MSASGQPTGDRCGKWMPRKKTYCARGAGHPPPCKTPEAMEIQRQRAAERRPSRTVSPAARARWRRAAKLQRFGLTQDRFDRLLEAQGNACGMCRLPFVKGQRICIDHDHACCPVVPGSKPRCCGKCVRGLLCFRCNVALGYVEMYGGRAAAYLDPGVTYPTPRAAIAL